MPEVREHAPARARGMSPPRRVISESVSACARERSLLGVDADGNAVFRHTDGTYEVNMVFRGGHVGSVFMQPGGRVVLEGIPSILDGGASRAYRRAREEVGRCVEVYVPPPSRAPPPPPEAGACRAAESTGGGLRAGRVCDDDDAGK